MHGFLKPKSILSLVAVVLLTGAIGGALVSGAHASSHATTPQLSGSGTPVSTSSARQVVDMRKVPEERPSPNNAGSSTSLPLLGVDPAAYARWKAAAASNKNAPIASFVYPSKSTTGTAISPRTPSLTGSFQGMTHSISICPPSGCEPPDMALAASPSWVFQGVNTSFAVYNRSGVLQTSWPRKAQTFFAVPSPGSCASGGVPNLADPRAFYDINDGRFWAAILEVEGFGTNSCPAKTLYHIAVSQTSNPTGAWNIYHFNMSFGSTNWADFVQMGFDRQALYFSGNMFNSSGAFQYAEIVAANKASMESGAASVTVHGFSNLTVGGVKVDTVQPVETEAHTYSGPNAGLFVNSFNIRGDPSGNNCKSTACKGIVVWAMANPISATPSLSSIVISTSGYTLAPYANEPGCKQCVDTLDTRITGAPVYHNGLISFALETGMSNGTQVVPTIFWGQVSPVLSDTGKVSSASVWQSGYFIFSGDTTVSFGTLMPDSDGNLFMVFELMSSTLNPETAYTARRVSFTPGRFHDGGIVLKAGAAPTTNFRWGDYEATSWDGFSANTVWFAGEYAPSNRTWSTYIGRSAFTTSTP